MDGSGNILETDITDTKGCYHFQGLEAGNYIVDVNGFDSDMPANYFLTTGNDPLYIRLAEGEDYSKADFGFMGLAPDVGVIGDYTWHDSNWNSNQDFDENSLSYVDVFLYRDNLFVDSMKTDIYGGYQFVNLPPGSYKVKARRSGPVPPNMSSSVENSSSSPQHEDWQITTTDSFYVDLSEGQVYSQADFGFAYPSENWGAGSEKILARYQTWYASAENDSSLRYWKADYFGGYADTSLFNEYSSYDEDLLEYHILSAWACGIDGFVIDWYGKESFENIGTKKLLDKTEELFQRYQGYDMDFQIALSYNEKAIGRLDSNFIYIGDSLMIHPAYWGNRDRLRRSLFLFNTEDTLFTPDEYRTCADTTLPAGTYLLWNNADTIAFAAMDVIYPWVQVLDGQWDPNGLDWGETYLDTTYRRMNVLSDPGDLIFALGSVWPGYDDREWTLGEDHWMSRQDTAVYQWTWDKVFDYNSHIDYRLPMPWCLIETWNDLNRATEIEATVDWDYRFNVLTRDNARRFKVSEIPEEVGVNNLGMLVPQHIHQAKRAARVRPEQAAAIQTLTAKARDNFFNRDHLTAISYADLAAGLAMKPITVDSVGINAIYLSWEAAEQANAYLVHYSQNLSHFDPCSPEKPNMIPVGNSITCTLTGPAAAQANYIAVTAVDTNLGSFANEGWYKNNIRGAQIIQIESNINSGITDQNNKPHVFSLSQNYPNPFNPETEINYSLPERQHVVLKVYDIMGREIKTLVDGHQDAGVFKVTFDGRNLPSGVYFLRLTTEKFTRTRRMILLK